MAAVLATCAAFLVVGPALTLLNKHIMQASACERRACLHASVRVCLRNAEQPFLDRERRCCAAPGGMTAPPPPPQRNR